MAEAEARGTARGLLVVAREQSYLTQAALELLESDATRPEEGRGLRGHVEHGRLHTHRSGPAVQDELDPAVEILADVLGACGARAAGRLAEGAAMGREAAWMRARATGWAGTRTATVSSPPVVMRGTAPARGSTRVSGPGQKRRATS
jgi:hypothetical protein